MGLRGLTDTAETYHSTCKASDVPSRAANRPTVSEFGTGPEIRQITTVKDQLAATTTASHAAVFENITAESKRMKLRSDATGQDDLRLAMGVEKNNKEAEVAEEAFKGQIDEILACNQRKYEIAQRLEAAFEASVSNNRAFKETMEDFYEKLEAQRLSHLKQSEAAANKRKYHDSDTV